MKTWFRLVLTGAFLAAAIFGAATPGVAAPKEGLATFQGRTIDLSVSWQGAQACAVISRTDVRCYASTDEANAALAPAGGAGVVTPQATWHGCPDNWLCIYADPSWGGRRLQFYQDYWQSLAPYGFDHQTSSWTNNQNNLSCGDPGILGNGSGDNRTLSDCSASSSLGSYDNKATDVHG
jgi:hypothetical protein